MKKIWVRVLFSLLLGAIIVEVTQTSYGEMSQEVSTVFLWVATIAVFLVVSLVLVITRRIKSRNSKEVANEDILDNM
jgi:L-asparagine transporter-like permease